MTLRINNAYVNSDYISILKKSLDKGQSPRIAFLDIDDTLHGTPEATNTAREALEALGFAVVFVTARTEEMAMTENSQRLSPKLDRKPAKFFSTQAEGVFDPHIIAGSTGTRILVRQSDGGYLPDMEFEAKMEARFADFRHITLQLIQKINKKKTLCQLAKFEDQENYITGKADVEPARYRIEVEFSSAGAMHRFYGAVRKFNSKNPYKTIKLINNSNPFIERFCAQLTPAIGGKGMAVEDIISKTLNLTGISRKELQVLIAGDSLPDLSMGFHGALGTDATFLVVGKAMLHPSMFERKAHKKFENLPGGELISFIRRKLKAEDPARGRFRYRLKVATRSVIFSQRAYPDTTGPESIIAYLSEKFRQNVYS